LGGNSKVSALKITGGSLKGQRLYTPASKEIRPLRSRIRKALFDTLGQECIGLKVFDLFAGTGALGIEALSRGAEFVVFVDSSEESKKLILKNLEKFKLLERAKVYKKRLPTGLKELAELHPYSFDLIFITPPYLKGLALKTLEALPSVFLSPETVVVVEEHSKVELPDRANQLRLFKKKEYGETALWFYSL